MNYTDLCANISRTVENTFTAEEYALFAHLAEQTILNSVQLANLKKTVTSTMTLGSQYLDAPADFLAAQSIAVIEADGTYSFLLPKDVSFIREAYPKVTSTGLPKFYAIFGATPGDAKILRFILGPTPAAAYSAEIQYFFYPESIVTAGTSWLGEHFDSALLNGCLVEAARFMKAEADIIALYQGMFTQSVALLKNLGDGKQRGDAYRDGQLKIKVS